VIRVRRVVGESMLPTLKPGQIVFVTPWVRLLPGKVVMARVRNREVIKRVKSVSPEGITLKGDNPDQSTDSRYFGPIDPRTILGVVIWPRNL
jgi:nickel-type superoxide dismutase maturation protease